MSTFDPLEDITASKRERGRIASRRVGVGILVGVFLASKVLKCHLTILIFPAWSPANGIALRDNRVYNVG
jgi:hypothetical protein